MRASCRDTHDRQHALLLGAIMAATAPADERFDCSRIDTEQVDVYNDTCNVHCLHAVLSTTTANRLFDCGRGLRFRPRSRHCCHVNVFQSHNTVPCCGDVIAVHRTFSTSEADSLSLTHTSGRTARCQLFAAVGRSPSRYEWILADCGVVMERSHHSRLLRSTDSARTLCVSDCME